VVLALSFGAVLTFYRSILPTTGQEALGGVLSVIAVVLVTGMIFWMRRTARSLSGELKAKVAAALSISTAALTLTAFLAVAREGVETALFLWTAAQATGQTVAPLVGAALGIAVAVVLCVLLYRSAVRIQLGVFFNRTAILLIVVAAGVFAYGLGDLQDAGLLPGHTWVAFDLSQHVDASSWWASIVTGVTELSPTMTWLQVIAYLAYLGFVLTTFVLGGRTPAPAPPPRQEEPEPVRHSRRRIAWSVGAALVVPPVAAAVLIVAAPGRSAAADQDVQVTAAACAPGWSGAAAGPQTFTVANKSGHTVEVTLVQAASQGIAAEIETLGPATQQTMSVTLTPGGYYWRCLADGRPTTTSDTVRVTGSAGDGGTPAVVRPVSVDDLRPAATAYDAYVRPKLATLLGQVAAIRTDLTAGNIAAARRDWLAAQLTWEQVGAAYDSFGDLGDAIDGLPQALPGGVADPHFTGLRRVEYGLWHGQPAAELVGVTTTLTSDIQTLQRKLPEITVDPTDMPVRAHEILEDASRDHLNGLTDEGAGAAYAETYADVQGTRVVLAELAPLVDARDPKLLPAIDAQLTALDDALLATRVNGQWRAPAGTPQLAQQRVNAAIGAVLENLSVVPDLLEVPAH
jgi:high-affinity iron transporter